MFDDQTKKRYLQLRETCSHINVQLERMVTPLTFDSAAKELGLLKRGCMNARNDNEIHALLDYCVYDRRPGGKSIIEGYAEQSTAPPDSDERRCLNAMLNARYSLVQFTGVPRGILVTSRDLLRCVDLQRRMWVFPIPFVSGPRSGSSSPPATSRLSGRAFR